MHGFGPLCPIFAASNHNTVLSFFRRDFLGIQLILLAYTLVLRGVGFTGRLAHVTQPEQKSQGYLFQRWFAWLDGNAWWMFILSALCIWLQAMMVNRLANEHKFTDRKTWFISLVYVFLASLAVELHGFAPVLLANFFFIPAISELFHTFRVAECRKSIFNTGFFLSLGALFAPPLLWMGVPLWLGFRSLRSFRIDEQLIYFIGLLLPFIMAGGYAFIQDDYDTFYNALAFNRFSLPAPLTELHPGKIISMVGYALALIFVFLSAFKYYSKRGIQSQKYISILYWLLLMAVVLIVFHPSLRLERFHYLLAPMAIFGGLSLEQTKNQQVAEIIHFLFLAALFSVHYFFTTPI